MTLSCVSDGAGNRTSMGDSLGSVVNDTYDARNELVNQRLCGTGISPNAVKIMHDNLGNMTGLTRYMNLDETTMVASTSYTYLANQITGIMDKKGGGTTLVSCQGCREAEAYPLGLDPAYGTYPAL